MQGSTWSAAVQKEAKRGKEAPVGSRLPHFPFTHRAGPSPCGKEAKWFCSPQQGAEEERAQQASWAAAWPHCRPASSGVSVPSALVAQNWELPPPMEPALLQPRSLRGGDGGGQKGPRWERARAGGATAATCTDARRIGHSGRCQVWQSRREALQQRRLVCWPACCAARCGRAHSRNPHAGHSASSVAHHSCPGAHWGGGIPSQDVVGTGVLCPVDDCIPLRGQDDSCSRRGRRAGLAIHSRPLCWHPRALQIHICTKEHPN